MTNTNTACTKLSQLSLNACNQRWGAKLKGLPYSWVPGTYALTDCAGKHPPGQVAR